ncbi:MAG: hypothetical protein A2Y04_05755 [Omnitrophica WOR_2 bacterium GWC2_45_7]|nr:MAG: hypothetical protein A2Y04_05755 [Omnitrophica WOR_2 bacterium GWC2_45_7]
MENKMKFFLYFSEILGRDVLDDKNQVVGKLCDMVLRLNNEVFPKAESIIVKKGLLRKEFANILLEDFQEVDGELKLKITRDQIKFQRQPFVSDFSIGQHVLDQQVVDIHDKKVVRVNDVHLLKVDNQLYLAHVDVGLRGIVRRLEWTKWVDVLVRYVSPKSPYLTQEELVSWKNTHVLNIGRTKNVVRLGVGREKLARIPPTALAEIMVDLDIFEKFSLFKVLNADMQRKVFTDLPVQEQEAIICQMEDQEAASLLEHIPADEATDLLLTLPKDKTRTWMRLMQSETSKNLQKLLGFSKDSAGGLMTTEYLCLGKDALVKDALQKIKDNVDYPGSIFYIYVVDDQHHLLGTTSFRRFINAPPQMPLAETCYPQQVFVRTDDGMEEVALLLERYKFSAIPVLNEEEVLQGVITSDDVLEELISLTWTKYKDQL